MVSEPEDARLVPSERPGEEVAEGREEDVPLVLVEVEEE
jgi:hypothetical protein